jgi:hypothetical protein
MNDRRGNIYWGLFLLLLGGLLLAFSLGVIPRPSENGWAIFFAVIALLFFVGYLTSGIRNWGLLFPAVGTGAIAATIWMAEAGVPGETIGGLFMIAISLPFWAAFLAGPRQNWWGLIPGGITAAIGVVVLLTNVVTPGAWVGTLIMLAIATSFFTVYVYNRRNWWALIPAGVMTSVAVMILVTGADREPVVQVRLVLGVLFAGLAATFAAVWLLHGREETDWAKYPAVGLGAMALLAIVLGPQIELVWPLVLVLIGVWLLIRAVRPGTTGTMKHL